VRWTEQLRIRKIAQTAAVQAVEWSLLCRVKKDTNFIVLAAEKSRWVGRKHKEVLPEMRGKTFEVEVGYVGAIVACR